MSRRFRSLVELHRGSFYTSQASRAIGAVCFAVALVAAGMCRFVLSLAAQVVAIAPAAAALAAKNPAAGGEAR
jgi:hypothetical protein